MWCKNQTAAVMKFRTQILYWSSSIFIIVYGHKFLWKGFFLQCLQCLQQSSWYQSPVNDCNQYGMWEPWRHSQGENTVLEQWSQTPLAWFKLFMRRSFSESFKSMGPFFVFLESRKWVSALLLADFLGDLLPRIAFGVWNATEIIWGHFQHLKIKLKLLKVCQHLNENYFLQTNTWRLLHFFFNHKNILNPNTFALWFLEYSACTAKTRCAKDVIEL